MDLLSRVKGILLTPETEWLAVEKEPGTPAYLLTNYVVYLAAIPPIAGFLGRAIIGETLPSVGTSRVGLFAGLLGAVIGYVLSFVITFAVAIIIYQLAPRFGSVKNFSSALKVTAYSLTPYWVAGVLQVVPGLRFVGDVVAFFGIYLVWLGLPRLMKTPADRAVAYVATMVVCAIVLVVAITLLAGAIVA